METVNQEASTNAVEISGEVNKTFTQDEVDRIVGDRLQRERSKYLDYESLKEKATKFDELEESNKSELQKITERAEKAEKELNSMKQAEELRKVREKVADDTGIPAKLLTGASEDECIAQAEAIKAFINPSYPNVKDGGEPQNTKGQATRDQFADWLNSQN